MKSMYGLAVCLSVSQAKPTSLIRTIKKEGNEIGFKTVQSHPIRPFQPEAVAQYMKYMQVVKKNAKNRLLRSLNEVTHSEQPQQ